MTAQPQGPMSEAIQRLEQAVVAGTIEDIVPEALEETAHNTLWRESSRSELTFLKLCPSIDTHSIRHEYDRIKSFGDDRGNGAFGEDTLPLETEPQFERVETFVRLIGETSSTFLLASLEKTIKVDGDTGADAIARNFLVKNLLMKINRGMYFMDTSTTRLGASGNRYQGALQQIREGTDGTVGDASPFGSHVIDMKGLPLTIENIRTRTAQVVTLYGFLNCLVMDPFARGDLEASMDGSQRNQLPIGFAPFFLGQHVGGLQTQGGQMWFHTDNVLGPLYAKGTYRGTAMRGAPTGAPSLPAAPTVNTTPTGANVSSWDAASAGNVFYLITEIKNERESLGARTPTAGTVAVTDGDEVEIAATPSDPLSDAFKVYRGVQGDADTDAWCIFEVANSGGGGPVTIYDLNDDRPGTGYAFAFNIRSESTEFLHNPEASGTRGSYAQAVEESANFLSMPDNPQNTVTRVNLGPAMGVMQLAALLAQTSRPLLYSAMAMQVRNARQNVVFKNIGSTSNPMTP